MDNQEYYSFKPSGQEIIKPKIGRRVNTHFLKGIIFIVLAILLIGGAVSVAYFTKAWPFSGIGAAQLFEEAIEKAKTIDSAYYDFSVEIKSVPRQADIKPFEYNDPQYQALLALYQQDNTRLNNAKLIINKLADYKYQHKKYPKTLTETGIIVQDPSGQIYPYTSDGKDFSFKIIFVTEEIPKFFSSRSYGKVDVNGQELTFHPLSYVEIGNLTPPKPLLVSIYDGLSKIASWVPNSFTLGGTISGNMKKGADAGSDAIFNVGGNLTMEDLIMNVDVESLKNGQDLYFKVKSFPGIPGVNLSDLKNKWIKVSKEDLGSVPSYYPLMVDVPTDEEDLLSTQNQLKTLLRLAKDEPLIKLKGEPIKEVINKEKVYHYQLEINKEKIASFYQKAANELESQYKEKALFKFDQEIFDELSSQATLSLVDYINQSISADLYISIKTGYPIKGSIAITAVPPASSEKTNQIVLSFSLGLSNINKEINIVVPQDFMTIEEAYMVISGIDKEEYLVQKQYQNISDIGSALAKFKSMAGRYPDFLDQLKLPISDIKKLKTTPEVKATSSSYLEISYPTLYAEDETKPLLNNIPTDVFTKQQYVYAKTSDTNYSLKYQMVLPEYKKGTKISASIFDKYGYYYYTDSSNYIMYIYYVPGINTKDASISSLEADAARKIDSDKDKMSDNLETYMGTDPNNKDTDKDGYPDGEELKSGYDPLSAGTMLQ